MIMFNPRSFAKQIVMSRPALNECWVSVHDSDLSLVIDVVDVDNELIARHDTGLDGNADTADADKLASQLVDELKKLGIRAETFKTFGWGWIDGEDGEAGNEWIQISTLDHSGTPIGNLDEELAVLMLRDVEKHEHLRKQRETLADFITNAMEAYINTTQGQSDWKDYLDACTESENRV